MFVPNRGSAQSWSERCCRALPGAKQCAALAVDGAQRPVRELLAHEQRPRSLELLVLVHRWPDAAIEGDVLDLRVIGAAAGLARLIHERREELVHLVLHLG